MLRSININQSFAYYLFLPSLPVRSRTGAPGVTGLRRCSTPAWPGPALAAAHLSTCLMLGGKPQIRHATENEKHSPCPPPPPQKERRDASAAGTRAGRETRASPGQGRAPAEARPGQGRAPVGARCERRGSDAGSPLGALETTVFLQLC